MIHIPVKNTRKIALIIGVILGCVVPVVSFAQTSNNSDLYMGTDAQPVTPGTHSSDPYMGTNSGTVAPGMHSDPYTGTNAGTVVPGTHADPYMGTNAPPVVPLAPTNPNVQQTNTLTTPLSASENPNNGDFRLSVCDGPNIPASAGGNPATVNGHAYVVCDFNGAMLLVQHLINLMIIAGVFLAMLSFVYGGYLYITGVPGNITTARSIFKNVGIGFILMITAWFIVFQILSWLTGNSDYTSLLGSP